MNKKYLITGSKGQLGKEFCRLFDKNSIEYKGVDIDDIDISNPDELTGLFASWKPDIIINCAAYNQVDLAESNYQQALKINAKAVQTLAEMAAGHKAFLVHYSSDYVFDGTKEDGLYTESDKTSPANKYGQSKYEGEKLLRPYMDNTLVFRLSWVFGEGTQNFIYKFRQWIEKNEILKISFDEVSVPTHTETVADVTLKAVDAGINGLWHLTNSGYASRYEWAKYILKVLGSKNLLYPVKRNIFNLPAYRPYFSAMSNENISSELNITIPDWEDAVKAHLKKVL